MQISPSTDSASHVHSHAQSDNEFEVRHIGPSMGEQQSMLRCLGVDSMDALIAQVVPAHLRISLSSDRPAKGETETIAALRALAAKNLVFKSYIGTGYYDTSTPAVILRNVLENPAWYTAYTPYQPEISQGRLEALLNFQTMVCDLTGMEIANASMLDEATAAAEGVALCFRARSLDAGKFFVSSGCHPQTIEVVRTRAKPLGIDIVEGNEAYIDSAAQYVGALLQYPRSDGNIGDYRELIKKLHTQGAMAVVATDLLALTQLVPPGEWDADVVVGSAQRFGVPMGYGGPHAAFFSTKQKFRREMPGRLVGVSIDANGRTALRLAAQTREQHIRRERATSNICTAQALLAVMASMYAVYHGPTGLNRIGARVHRLTCILANGLKQLGWTVLNKTFFDTLTVQTGNETAGLHASAHACGMNFRQAGADRIGLSLDETTTASDVESIWRLFCRDRYRAPELEKIELLEGHSIPDTFRRKTGFLAHPVFNSYHSETKMLRYMRSLADRDLALDRTMIPLGSCTMKLNATTEMIPVTWREFSGLHPFAPMNQAIGYRELIAELEKMLCECTGYDAVSLQPNAGSQGELAGLLAIRAYHEARGQSTRNVCLIPSSAHGTNPATANMAGMKVVVVACDSHGNVDMTDLRAKVELHRARLAAIMITYPSTHGVFEEDIKAVCDVVHEGGGQVYIDGANLNAQVGLTSPGFCGGDVSHLNLHKTFCIPHGGGGPGVGPIGVKTHLKKYLPGHGLIGLNGAGAVSAAPWGSASILPISWAYITMMGSSGLRRATEIAILNANYIAHRLCDHFPILYVGKEGRVAHECILDLRALTHDSGISAEDVAKRLIDFGFHAPTMSFPVPGTLMVEPTESEDKAELDRFCNAMIRIRQEIKRIQNGEFNVEDNPLTNAPHTAEMIADNWEHSYSRSEAAFPLSTLRAFKYWPPVARVDNLYGDKNLVCSCPPVSDYSETEPTPA